MSYTEPKCSCGKRGHFSVWKEQFDKFFVVFCTECGQPAGALEGLKGKAQESLEKKISDLETRLKSLEGIVKRH